MERRDTRGRHDDYLVGLGDGVVVDLDGDAAAGSGHPSEVVEVAAEVGDQGARLPHGLAFQVGLRAQVRKAFLRRDRRCRRSHSLSHRGFVLRTKKSPI